MSTTPAPAIPAHFAELRAAAVAASVPARWFFDPTPDFVEIPTLIARSANRLFTVRVTYSEAEAGYAVALYRETSRGCRLLGTRDLDGAEVIDFIKAWC